MVTFQRCRSLTSIDIPDGVIGIGAGAFLPRRICVTSWTKLFATNEVQFTDKAFDNFLAFVDHMSCSADTYVSLGGSNIFFFPIFEFPNLGK